jgi:hypothetical protein
LNRRERVLSTILESGVSPRHNFRFPLCVDLLLIAAIYTAILVCLVGTSVTGNSAQFLLLNLVNSSIWSECSFNDTHTQVPPVVVGLS